MKPNELLKIDKMLVPESQYWKMAPYHMEPKGLCIHNTANKASAYNEVSYMTRYYGWVSWHFAVDDKHAIQALPLDRNGWHAGDGRHGWGNRNTIGIEICYSSIGGPKFDKAEDNGARLAAILLNQYGWGLDKVYKHQDFMNKYCPHRTLDRGWDRFLRMIEKYLGMLTSNATAAERHYSDGWYTTTPARLNVRKSPSGDVVDIFKHGTPVKVTAEKVLGKQTWVQTSTDVWLVAKDYNGKEYIVPRPPKDKVSDYPPKGKFTPDRRINVRAGKSLTSDIVTFYRAGQPVYYDQVHINDGHVWISYIGLSSGKRRYMAIKQVGGATWGKLS